MKKLCMSFQILITFVIALSFFGNSVTSRHIDWIEDQSPLPLRSIQDQEQFSVRLAKESDFDALMELDRRVTFEFFEPLFQNHYAHTQLGKHAHSHLEEAVALDEKLFVQAISCENNQRLLIATDQNNKACGLLQFSKIKDTELLLDLLVVDSGYRGRGIGKMLVLAACKKFPEASVCHVYPCRFGNDPTLLFYQSLGFVQVGFAPAHETNQYGESLADLYFNYKLSLPLL
jgi:ribosomal protein S18 acetylase RimI-like enzyme